MSVLVLGDTGQLATHLKDLLPDAHFWGRATRDLSETEKLLPAIIDLAPSAIVNAAAYTAVDGAESAPELAWRLNAELPAAASKAAARLAIPLLHFSTDYVFDGRKTTPYAVNDPVNPLNVYGTTKLGGELAIRVMCPAHWILRTSWVFSEHGSNFVKTMLRLGRERKEVSVVADQFGRPTYAADLARLAAELVRTADASSRLPYGTYHAVGGPSVSWHAFAAAVFRAAADTGKLDRAPLVHAIPSSEYRTAATRPMHSVLEPSAELEAATGIVVDWTAGLSFALSKLGGAAAANP